MTSVFDQTFVDDFGETYKLSPEPVINMQRETRIDHGIQAMYRETGYRHRGTSLVDATIFRQESSRIVSKLARERMGIRDTWEDQ